MDRELLQDSDGVNESFWDGQGVEIEAKYFSERVWGEETPYPTPPISPPISPPKFNLPGTLGQELIGTPLPGARNAGSASPGTRDPMGGLSS